MKFTTISKGQYFPNEQEQFDCHATFEHSFEEYVAMLEKKGNPSAKAIRDLKNMYEAVYSSGYVSGLGYERKRKKQLEAFKL